MGSTVVEFFNEFGEVRANFSKGFLGALYDFLFQSSIGYGAEMVLTEESLFPPVLAERSPMFFEEMEEVRRFFFPSGAEGATIGSVQRG